MRQRAADGTVGGLDDQVDNSVPADESDTLESYLKDKNSEIQSCK